MGQTIIEKILSRHAGRPVRPGDIVDVAVDARIARDFGGANVVKNIRDHGLPVDDAAKTFFTFDCNPGGSDQKYAANQHACRLFARERGVNLFDVDAGIGTHIAIEEGLVGPELSVLAFSDGRTVLPMPPARDHKRVFDGDQGPNTGGMGAYSPVPGVSQALLGEVCRTVLQPAIDGMASRGTPYTGVLYAGLMLTAGGPKVLEFNCRFGDPETQAILPLLIQNGEGTTPPSSLLDILLACTEGRLAEIAPDVHWHPGACATVVLAAPGYPGSYPKGLPISGLDEAGALQDAMVFHAGTATKDGRIVTNGGRVLAVSAIGADLQAALERAYGAARHIRFDGVHYRRDIGTDKRQQTADNRRR